jgi:hypothetical protein
MSAKVALEKIASKNPIEAPTPDFLCLYSTSIVDLSSTELPLQGNLLSALKLKGAMHRRKYW